MVCLISPSLQAAKTDNIYTSEILVPDNETRTRETFLPKALTEVLIKSSGNIDIIKNPNIAETLKNAENLLLSYGYVTHSLGDNKNGLYLRAEFDENAINNILTKANQKVWDKNRPKILVWLNVPDLKSKILIDNQILDQNSQHPAFFYLQNHSFRLGLPIIIPTMDAEETKNISEDAICNFDTKALETASTRYTSDVLLIGCIKKNMILSGMEGNWLLVLNNNNSEKFTTKGNDIESIIRNTMDNVFIALTKKTPLVKNNTVNTPVTLHISGVSGLNEYARIIKYVQALDSVTSADILTVTENKIAIKIITTGNNKALETALQNGKNLVPDGSIQKNTEADDNLYYRWINNPQ